MDKKLKFVLNIMPCAVVALLCILSFIPISISEFFTINWYAPFFLIFGILFHPVYIAIIKCMNLERGKYAKNFLDMNLVLIISNLLITLVFMLVVRTNIIAAIDLLIVIILYDIFMLSVAFTVAFIVKYILKNIREKKPVRAIIKVLPVLFLLLIAGLSQIIALSEICVSVNNSLVLKTVRILEEIPLPQNTEYIETATFTGRVSGTGDGTDIFAAMLIKSELPEEELNEYYSAYDYGTEQGKYFVTKQSEQRIDNIYSADVYWTCELNENDKYYMVYVYGKTIAPFSWFDIRGM